MFRKKIKKLNRKRALRWINKNLRGHPFILGILFLVWISYILRMFLENMTVTAILKLNLKLISGILIAWLGLVLLSNSLKDKERTKWYFKKRLVFFLLIFLYPLGLILLWTGSRFKKKTKTVLTIIFSAIFIFSAVQQQKRYHTILNMSPFDNVIETITSKKRKTFLESSAPEILEGFNFTSIADYKKTKLAISDIYSRYSSGVVSIKTRDRYGRQIGLGSGFILSKDGIIVTNSHVVESAYQAEIKIGDRIFDEVYLVKNLPVVDIAILKIDAEDLSPLFIGNSDNLESGQFIVALGNPLGFEQSVSSGIISAIRSSRNMKLIQMTVPISPGSSGGPVLNEYGEVVGIATVASLFFAQNLNFAIPINYLKRIIE